MVEDATPPEFDGYHPGVIIRACSTLSVPLETVSFVPLTSTEPEKMTPYIHRMSRNPNPIDSRPIWAICNHIYTVRLTRLELYYDGIKDHTVPKIAAEDLNAIFVAIRNGFTIAEVPIEFADRTYGDSKMSQRIVAEAMWLTTRWGIAHRWSQLKALLTRKAVTT